MKRFFSLLLCCLPLVGLAGVDTARLVQLVDYIGVDYAEAVADGQIISQGEYAEMQDFAAAAAGQIGELEAGTADSGLVSQARALQRMIAERSPPQQVANLAGELRQTLLDRFEIVAVPRRAPDPAQARAVFAQHCASCHGATGRGDGPLAQGMEPAPTNFHDSQRYAQRTLHGLYSTITLGVDETGMTSFAATLSERERWNLAFYVGRMGVAEPAAVAGSTAWSQARPEHPLKDLQTLTTTTPAEARARWGENGRVMMAHARSQPSVLFARHSPLVYADNQIQASLDAYRAGDADSAYEAAVTAYLEGFELAEPALDAAAPQLRREVEDAMTGYRELVRGNAEVAAVASQAEKVRSLLDAAAGRLDSATLSHEAAFTGAFVILVREGLEALLVVAALAAFLIRTGRREGLPYLHLGWAAALLLGALTWWLSQTVIDFSGASREITEGVAALVAMAVLFYVGFWLHNKTHARQWQRFIEGSVEKALSRGTLWGLTGLAFIAVYREVFETILFYQAMWVQADAQGQGFMMGGLGAAAAALLVMGWLILRYSVRLPLRQFFAATSVFMFALAVVFAGKGVAALQEAGKLPVDPVSFPRVDLLGVYPNLQGLLLQAGLILLAVATIAWSYRQRGAAA